MSKVYVVMQNDYPKAVFSDGDAAQAYVNLQPKESHDGVPLFWRIFHFDLNGAAQ